MRTLALGFLALALSSVGASAGAPDPPMRPVPATAQDSLRKAIRDVIALVPDPGAPYVLHPEESRSEVQGSAPFSRAGKRWTRPARASAERYYDVPNDAPGASPELREFLTPVEVTAELNGELRFVDLASEGGPPTLFPLANAAAVEIAAIVPGAVQGRSAAMTPEQSEYRLTALTIVLGDALTERAVRRAVRTGSAPSAPPSETASAAEIRRISILLHGPKKYVEGVARKLPVQALRRFLHR